MLTLPLTDDELRQYQNDCRGLNFYPYYEICIKSLKFLTFHEAA